MEGQRGEIIKKAHKMGVLLNDRRDHFHESEATPLPPYISPLPIRPNADFFQKMWVDFQLYLCP